MKPLTKVASPIVSLPDADIDTDIIYPARFLLITNRQALGRYAFHDQREALNFHHPIDRGLARNAEILATGANFGCGSSREQAPWALLDLGIRVIIAPSFGEIFKSNCFKNGMLPITLGAETISILHEAGMGDEIVSVDLQHQIISVGALTLRFEIEPMKKQALLNGWDEIPQILATYTRSIQQFEQKQRERSPWLWVTGDTP